MANDKGIPAMVQGRIVWVIGNLFSGAVALQYGTQNPKLGKDGKPYQEYGFGLAVPKSAFADCSPGAPGFIWTAVHQAAQQVYPNGQVPKDFAMKFQDGDTALDKDGRPLSQKEGYAGCMIFTCKTTMPIKFYKTEGGQHFQINEGIKCGDYVNVQLSVRGHGAPNAGLYLNPYAVQFAGYGKEIVSAPSASSIFGTGAPVLPPGASATPIMPQGMLMPTNAPAAPPAMPQAYAPQVPQQQFAPPAMPAAQPNYGVLPPQFAPPGMPQAPNGFAPPAVQSYPQTAVPTAGAAYLSNQGQPQQFGLPQMPGFPKQ